MYIQIIKFDSWVPYALFKEKNYMFVSKKMEILQENTKMMNRYCFSLNNIEIKPCF